MVEVRDATPADAQAIAIVHVASWRAAYEGLLPAAILASLSVSAREQMWSQALSVPPPHTRIVVATIATRTVGFAATGPPLRPADGADPSLGDLYALYLDPHVWGRGIGARLHAAALDGLRRCGFTDAGLWILDGNERALRFYTRHGWTDTGRTQVDRGPQNIALHECRLHRTLAAD